MTLIGLTDRQILRNTERISKALEKRMNRLFVKEFDRLKVEDSSQLESVLAGHEAVVQSILFDTYRIAGRIQARFIAKEIYANIKSEASTLSAFELFINRWAEIEAGKQAKNISATTRNNLRDILAIGITEGLNTQQIAKVISSSAFLSRTRAVLIAVTETHNANMAASLATAQEAQVDTESPMYKKWIPVEDPRTRDNHRAMENHKWIPIDEAFKVGGSRMQRPGDSAGGASNVIRCRCALKYATKEQLRRQGILQ